VTEALIVENDAPWANIVEKVFPGHFNCDVAPTMEMAERLLQEKSYDLVVADLILDDREPNPFNRFDHISRLFATIEEREADIRAPLPVIVVTVHDLASDIPNLLNSWPGRIYGWHQKETFNGEKFLRNVQYTMACGTAKGNYEPILPPSKIWSLGDLFRFISNMSLPDQGVLITIATAFLSLAFYLGSLTP